MKAKRKAKPAPVAVVFDPECECMDSPDRAYMNHSELAYNFGVSRETVANELRQFRIGPIGKRNGHWVYHFPTLALSRQLGRWMRLACLRCGCRSCSLLRQTYDRSQLNLDDEDAA